ncbi:1-aminocyclopropane-1-carboxylate oxidase homolog 1-like [Cornus florida]|uniref:1-aminocyclopropane-1-carboxylate oxidase homolog 1-like n=1 Tax=Cornus florida TaxID=4283 RepID=UPI00289A713B|nr:1-aminocyclopropane-1-carboxylate oxidase homolog 1-like [Cornus florida]
MELATRCRIACCDEGEFLVPFAPNSVYEYCESKLAETDCRAIVDPMMTCPVSKLGSIDDSGVKFFMNLHKIVEEKLIIMLERTKKVDITGTRESTEAAAMDYDRAKEVKAFDDTKAGVKGLVDAGAMNIPRIFIRPPEEIAQDLNCLTIPLQVPVIDLSYIEKDDHRRKGIVDEIRIASEKWGFFQVVNHGIPLSVLSEMMNGVRAFHEQPSEVKKEFYTRDRSKKVRLECNYDLYRSTTANWRDTMSISLLLSDHLDPHELPLACRDSTIEFIKDVSELGDTIFELLSEALGLKPNHLRDMGCSKGCGFACHYYPACPEPDLTLGASKHSDPTFITILLQDQIGGLQVLHDNHWVDVQPIVGSLVVNIGDTLQIISNDKFRSVEHRVLANRVGPRISVACFLTAAAASTKVYGPIEELISEESPPLYREFTVSEYISNFRSRALDTPGLDHFKL